MTSTFQCKAGFGSTDFSLCAFLRERRKSKSHRLKPALLVRPAGTLRVSAVAIAGYVFGQSFSGNLDPHSRRVTDGPAVFAIRLGLIATPDQFGFDRGLIVIFNRGCEVSDVGLMLGVLTLPEV